MGSVGSVLRECIFYPYCSNIVFSFLIDLYIDRLDLLCANENLASCLSESPQGVPYSFDKHHVSLEFSEMSGRLYAKKNPTLFSDILNNATAAH